MDKHEEPNVVPLQSPILSGDLPFSVELWDLSRQAPERVIGRAASLVVARAIFTAAMSEHLGRRLLLRRGLDILQESG